ncbi:GntR family transcriptional regulator [Starkeya sp. ORNL1]|uniref:GntR family transcriptional regulator n=1 Tax=Starkeya sp. ORNL1 TaxID=2709380 RepID=UPI0014643F42|nr:GntR family transcriptional regulator [Starkeya sp. ORNL1]QJP16024.1 GntR family transcriptional regulator [Starkeya sp. ORNL1]
MATAEKTVRDSAVAAPRGLLKPLPPLEPNLPLGEAVFQSLYRALQTGVLGPGDRLREEDIAGELAVSRTPVREALSRMQDRRFVVPAGGRGLLVRRLDLNEVLELYAMREILEGAAARLAATQITRSEILMLEDIQQRLDQSGEDHAAAASLNRRFHEVIAQGARNRYLDLAIAEIKDVILLLRDTTFSEPGRNEAAGREHRLIIDGLSSRDPDAAEHAARNHIHEALKIRLKLLG